MRFAKILSVASLPMFLFACSDSNGSGNFGNNPGAETPEEEKKDSIPENILDEDLKPITRDYSTIWKNGDGSATDPYLISNEEELISLAFYVNDSSMTFKDKFFKLTADIALTKAWKPIGVYGQNADGVGNRPFSGTFDGASKTISGMTVSDTSAYTGLFGLARNAHISNVVIKGAKMNVGSIGGVLAGLADTVTVENCSIENAEIQGADHVGGLVGEAKYVTVSNVSVTGTVGGTNNVGGVLGSVQNGTLSNLTNKATVAGKSIVGGIVGASSSVGNESSISMVLNYGAVTGTKGDVGGVAAKISTTKIEQSGNYGAVTAGEDERGGAGGVVAVASSKSSMNEVFNTGAVTGTKLMAVGGVVGSLKAVKITNIFNQGEVTSTTSKLGGLVGIADADAVLESGYNSGKVSDNNNSGMVAGKANSLATMTNIYYDQTVAGTGLVIAEKMSSFVVPTGFTTEEMKAATFVATLNGSGAVWSIDPAKFGGYPSFGWVK